jgi:hypothetical protein
VLRRLRLPAWRCGVATDHRVAAPLRRGRRHARAAGGALRRQRGGGAWSCLRCAIAEASDAPRSADGGRVRARGWHGAAAVAPEQPHRHRCAHEGALRASGLCMRPAPSHACVPSTALLRSTSSPRRRS